MPRTPADSHDDAAKADIGLVHAIGIEVGTFFDRCERTRSIRGAGFKFRGGRYREIRIASVESGPGMPAAARATRALIDGHGPRWIISCGFAGALRPGLRIGDVVVASTVCDLNGEELPTPSGIPADPAKGLHVGRFVTVPKIVRTVADKQELATRFDAIACDMETLAVAQVCRDANVRFLAIRTITDDLSADLPTEVHTLLTRTGARRIGATLGALWQRPESAKDLWKLREQAGYAAKHLAEFLPGVITQLHKPGPR